MRCSAIVALAAVAACTRPPERVDVELSTSPLTLSAKPTVLRPKQPVAADNDSVGVCVTPAPGYVLERDWGLSKPGKTPAHLQARATLTSGRVVRLTSLSYSGDLCLHPELDGPLEAKVAEIQIASSAPLETQKSRGSQGTMKAA